MLFVSGSISVLASESTLITWVGGIALLSGFALALLFMLIARLGRLIPIVGITRKFLRLPTSVHARANQEWALPAVAMIGLITFGLSGLVAGRTVGDRPGLAFAVSFATSLVACFLVVRAIQRWLSSESLPMEGSALVGKIGTVTLEIPSEGVGRLTYFAEGKRLVVPARTVEGCSLAVGDRALVLKVERGQAVVEAF